MLLTDAKETTSSTSALGLAVPRREGAVEFDSLRGTAIVTISAAEIDDRQSAYGGADAAVFSERARKFWKVARLKQARIERFIAILAGSRGVILGDWDVNAGPNYGDQNDVFPLVNPRDDDPRRLKGMRLVGVNSQSGRIYSKDLRG